LIDIQAASAVIEPTLSFSSWWSGKVLDMNAQALLIKLPIQTLEAAA